MPNGAPTKDAIATFDPTAPLTKGVTLLEASAGTGKTYSITSIVVRLVVETGVSVDRILAVTFTNLATAELTSRIRHRLTEAWQALQTFMRTGAKPGDEILRHLVDSAADAEVAKERAERARKAVESFDKAPIATIHGFCQRILQQHALDAGVAFDVELLENAAALVDEIVEDFWVKKVHDASDLELDALEALGVSLKELRELAQRAVANWSAIVLPERPGPTRPPSTEAIEAAVDRAAALLADGAEPATHAIHRSLGDWRGGNWKPFDSKFEDARRAAEKVVTRRLDPKTIEQLELLDEAWLGTNFEVRPPVPEALTQAVHQLRKLYREWLPQAQPWALELRHELVAYARSEAARRCNERRLWTFDDLLRKLEEALKQPAARARLKAAVGAHYEAIFIDEFQDTDPVQWNIFSQLFADKQHWLYLIGDPKQAIYRFRRADIRTYLMAKQSADFRYSLEKNHRSDVAVVDAVNDIFGGGTPEKAARAFAVDGFGFHPSRAKHLTRRLEGGDATPVRFLVEPRTPATIDKPGDFRNTVFKRDFVDRELPGRVASDIARALGSGQLVVERNGDDVETRRPIRPSDIAVLVRTNPQAELMCDALRAVGVPGILHEPRSVFDTGEAEELVRVLRAVLEPARTRVVRAALVTRLLGGGGRQSWRAPSATSRASSRSGPTGCAPGSRRGRGGASSDVPADRLGRDGAAARARGRLAPAGQPARRKRTPGAADRDLKPAGLLQHLERQRRSYDERDDGNNCATSTTRRCRS
ncbi:MAG: UvrD-helicase domain-containing protein [Myxococcota bacterium]